MTEIMLRDAALAHDLHYVALRCFNVAGADPAGRSGQSTPNATHLIKIAVQAALGRRSSVEVFGTDYPDSRWNLHWDYIHVSDLVAAHLAALRFLRDGGKSESLNCGCGRGYSVLDVINSVKRACGLILPCTQGYAEPATLASLLQTPTVSKRFLDGSHAMTISI